MARIQRRTFLQGAVATVGGALLGGRCRACWRRRPGVNRAFVRWSRWPTCATGSCGCSCRPGFQYRSFHDTDGPPVVLDDGTVLARPPRRHGAPSRPRRQRLADPQPRDQRPRRRPFGPPRPVRRRRTTRMARAGRRRSLSPPHGEVARGVHQPQRHADELRRRAHAVGLVDHLRGDGQRTRRRPRLHRRVQRAPAAAPRLHLRGARRAGSRTASRSRSAGRFAHEAAAYSPRRGHRLPHRGQLRLPVRPLPLHPAGEPDAVGQPRRTAAGCRC